MLRGGKVEPKAIPKGAKGSPRTFQSKPSFRPVEVKGVRCAKFNTEGWPLDGALGARCPAAALAGEVPDRSALAEELSLETEEAGRLAAR